ncbi:hypothetical protein V5O48_015125 [Marasmius crinis-equi]|uniref:NmrA-like domain-containing protein n=1 Tax=Marasmius crinis-equi TaxID=585013 RepID=A0ABR3EVE0_9AGAR
MSEKVKVLVTGVTGYIGGAVICRFLARNDASSFDFRAVVRSPEKAEKLKSFGITPIVGSHNDEELMVKAASGVDMVIAMADADDLVAAKATLKGLKKRFEETGKPPIFINTSGTGVLVDHAAGMYVSDTIYNDADPDQIETLAPTQMHRNVDLEIVRADETGYVRSHIVLPSTIYSIARGPLFDAGISNPYSIQVPALIRASLDRKQAGMIGEGANVWPNVDIHEVADLYSVLYDSIVKNPKQTGHGREGIYFGASGEHRLYDVSEAIGRVLVELGITTTVEPTTFSKEEILKYFKGYTLLGSNSRCRANRSMAIGWDPKKTTKDLLESVRAEVEAWMQKRRSSSDGGEGVVSGTLVVADKAEGMNTTETVYDDANSAQIEATISRDVDVEVAGADKEGYVRTHIIVPSTIYSIARGPLFEAGISNPHSLQVPLLIKASLNRKQAGMVGKGVNVWPNVDIHELADLYSVLLDSTLKNPEKTGHGRDGFYFGVAGEHRLYDLGKAVGDALVSLGIAKTPEPTTFTHEEIGQYFWGSPYILGSNVRCQANRSISIGWNPKKTSEDLLKSIRPEVEALVKRESSS